MMQNIFNKITLKTKILPAYPSLANINEGVYYSDYTSKKNKKIALIFV